jgi:hypothetical protein
MEVDKIESYIVKKGLQNKKGLDKYIDMILTEKSGVIVGKIIPQEQVQLSLFDKLDRDKRKSIKQLISLMLQWEEKK